jgi:hypothetical protein
MANVLGNRACVGDRCVSAKYWAGDSCWNAIAIRIQKFGIRGAFYRVLYAIDYLCRSDWHGK